MDSKASRFPPIVRNRQLRQPSVGHIRWIKGKPTIC